jgi:cobaltochelatase CobS
MKTMSLISLNEMFPAIVFKEPDVRIPVFDSKETVPLNAFYVPQPDVLEELLIELSLPADGAIGLVGETGTGKTEMVWYLAHHLRMPLATVQVHSAMRPEQIEGGMELRVKDGCSVSEYVEQAVVNCYRNGGIIFLDEIDKASAELQASLHALIDNKSWTLSNGTVVYPHPLSRVLAAANTIGDGFSTRYITSQQLDSALRSRISWHRMDYPTVDVELDILRKKYPEIPVSLANDMVRIANVLRDALLGVDRRDSSSDPIGEPFSTRTLVKWAARIVGYKHSKTLLETFHKAYLNGVSEKDHQSIIGMVQRVLNAGQMDMTLQQLTQALVRPARSARPSVA